MKNEETITQKELRELSEIENPYQKSCVGMQLWSEGFRAGYKKANEEKAKTDSVKVCTDKSMKHYCLGCKLLNYCKQFHK